MALRSSVVRRAIRSVACFRRREIFGVPNIEIRSLSDEVGRQFLPYLRFSTAAASGKHTAADTGLFRLVESEVNSTEHAHQANLKALIPDGFPVQIEDNPEEGNIYLTWKYHEELIKVVVRVWEPPISKGYYKLADIDSFSLSGGLEYKLIEYDAKNDEPKISMTVSVSKGDAHTLLFQITAFSDEISIDDLSIKNFEYSKNQLIHEGPYIDSVNDNLREALIKYLEIRGINLGFTNLLLNYMENKDYGRDLHFEWFKTLKGFLER